MKAHKGWWVALALAGGCFGSGYAAAPVFRFGGGKTARQAQHEVMAEETPPVLVTTETWSGEITAVKLRVYADEDFRGQNMHWQDAFDDRLAYANEVLAPLVGIQLVPDYREWDHHAAQGTAIETALDELKAYDNGTDVFVVVGLVSAFGLSDSYDKAGVAYLGGRHIIMRGYAASEEREAFERLFHDLGPDERERLYKARRRHKTAAVLLHELGHCLDATHDADVDTLMSPMYSYRAASFSPRSREIMLAAVDLRLGRGGAIAPAATAHPQLVIRVDAKGAITIAGVTMALDGLDEMLEVVVQDDPQTEVVIEPAAKAPRDVTATVGAHATAAGLKRVSITWK